MATEGTSDNNRNVRNDKPYAIASFILGIAAGLLAVSTGFDYYYAGWPAQGPVGVYGVFLMVFGALTILGSLLVLLSRRVRFVGAILILVFGLMGSMQEIFSILGLISKLLLPILSFFFALLARNPSRAQISNRTNLLKDQTEQISIIKDAFQCLRDGFLLSAIALLILAPSLILIFISPLWTLAVLIYIVSIIRRAKGWKLLGMKNTEHAVLYCGALFTLSSLWLFASSSLWIWMLPTILNPFFGGVTMLVFLPLITIVPWGIYTYFENRSYKELDEKLGINLRPPRTLTKAGALLAVITAFSAFTLFFYLAIPMLALLIASCLLLFRRLRLPDAPQQSYNAADSHTFD